MPDDNIESSQFEEEYEGDCLRSIDANRHFSTHTCAAELIKHDEDLQDKLLKVQEESRRIETESTITRDQQELLLIHEL